VTESEVKVDLDVDTYNYLRSPLTFCPRILVVLVLPVEETEWLSQSANELAIRNCAYWLSLGGYAATTAARSIRVTIPLANAFSVDAVRSILRRVQERKEP
jgi:Domain of unknown function (DUF4365)